MFIKKINYISSIFLIIFLLFSFYPTSTKADVANCSIDSFYVVSGLSVEATWSMYSTTGGTYYDVYMSWDGGPQFLVGKQDGDPSFADSGLVSTTFSNYGTHTVTINVGGVHCSDIAYLNIPDPGPSLGTICADANIGTRIVITGPGGTFVGNPSVCADTVVGTYTVTGDPVANYNGPSYSNGQTLTIPAGGAVSTFLTYSPYLYRCSGAGSCIRDDVNGNTTSSNCNNSCVAPVNGACGTANGKTYASTVTSYGSDTQCSSGSSSNTAFPSAGGSVSWTCSGSNGGSSSGTCSASRSATAPTATISASPTSVTSGGSSILTWSSTNATSCSVSPGSWTGTSGSQSTGALSVTTTYTVTCTGPGGSTSSSATVTVSGTSVNGACGTAAKTYASTATSYGTDTFCSAGTASPPTPTFPSAGSSSSWSCLGSGTGSTASCTATRSASGNSVTVSVNQPSGGSVQSSDSPKTINCGSACSSAYSLNASVNLQAYPASSYWKFAGWSGDCTGTGICSLVVNGAKSVTATFVLRSFNYNEF